MEKIYDTEENMAVWFFGQSMPLDLQISAKYGIYFEILRFVMVLFYLYYFIYCSLFSLLRFSSDYICIPESVSQCFHKLAKLLSTSILFLAVQRVSDAKRTLFTSTCALVYHWLLSGSIQVLSCWSYVPPSSSQELLLAILTWLLHPWCKNGKKDFFKNISC